MSTDQTYRAIADPTRREILDLLARHGTLAAGQIAQRIPGLSRPAVSRHLRVLRQARLVASQRQGQHRTDDAATDAEADGREQHYSLSPQPLELVQEWVSRYRSFWTDKLEELAQQAEKTEVLSPKAGAAVDRDGRNADAPLYGANDALNRAVSPVSDLGLRPSALPMLPPQPLILSGERAVLIPLTAQAIPFVEAALEHRDIWQFTTTAMDTPADAAAYVQQALDETAVGRAQAFGIMARSGNGADSRLTFAGSTRFGNVSLENARVEIGWTWLLPQFQRSGLNRECKLLLLTYAFEQLRARRVEFKGDARNMKSQNALRGIGATYEGTLRRHIVLPSGGSRDSFYYSVIAEEWPEVKARLTAAIV